MQISIKDVGRELGFDFIHGKNKCPNPNHNDKNPSCSVDLKKNIFYCFSCGYKGNSKTLIRDFKIKRHDFKKVAVKKKEKEIDKSLFFKRFFSFFKKEKFDYLASRGIDCEIAKKYGVFEIEKNELNNFVRIYQNKKRWEELGFFNKYGHCFFEKHRLVIPFFENKKIIGLQVRDTDGSSIRYKTFKKTKMCLFGDVSFKNIIITEGVIDALSVMTILKNNYKSFLKYYKGFGVVAIPSSPIQKNHLRFFKNKNIVSLIENDDAGNLSIDRLKKISNLKRINFKKKDANEYLLGLREV